jgi:hypothetical protein
VYGPQELRLRKTMRYYFWETEETKNLLKMDAEANVPLEEKVVENKQAETGKS